MSDPRFESVGEIFRHAIELDGDARADYLREATAGDEVLRLEVERMLVAAGEPDELLDAGPGVALSGEYGTKHGLEGRMVGAFRVLRHIASGGMGAVYEAEQDNPRRRVAVKVLGTAFGGEEVRRRFEREAAILGSLQHPGIAQIYEAGTYRSEGGLELPFIAMELVPSGRTVIDHVRVQGLAVRERTELFSRVCDAVEYAHKRGIVHRDLKPANVLVDEAGQPKVLDFGVAHIAGSGVDLATLLTEPGVLLGTLAYMSPEQARGDVDAVDARADVHALGVLLFELLTGRLPYDVRGCPIPEAVRLLNEDEPTTLSAIDPSLHGDLDTIVHKALEKEPERRYASAAELAADLGRYLRDEPIHARRPTRLYRLRKFTRRHRALVVATSLIAVSLVAGTVASVLAAADAREQTRVADEALAEAQLRIEQMHEMLSTWWTSTAFGSTFPQLAKLRKLELDIIDRSAPGFRDAWEAIDAEKVLTGTGFATQFRERGDLLIGLGRGLSPAAQQCAAGLLLATAWSLILYGEEMESSRLLQHAATLLEDDVRSTDPRLLVVRALLIDCMNYEGRHDESERLATGWLDDLASEGYPDSAPQVALYRSRRGAALVGLGRYEDAEPLLLSSDAVVRDRWGDVLAFEVKAARVALHEGAGRTESARALRRELAHDVSVGRSNGPIHAVVALGSRLSDLWVALDSFEDACELPGGDVTSEFDKLLELRTELGVEDDSPEAGIVALYLRLSGNWHGNVHGWGDDATLAIYQEAMRLMRIAPHRSNREYAWSLQGLAMVHLERGEFELAAMRSREGLEVCFEQNDSLVWELRSSLGQAFARMRRFEDGHQHLLASYQGLAGLLGPTDPVTRTAVARLISLHLAWGTGKGAAESRVEVESVLPDESLERWQFRMQVIPSVECVLSGEPLEVPPEERVRVANALYQAKHFALSAEMYSRAFEGAPALAADLEARHRYYAASSAALAPGDEWQQQSIAWLRADLEIYRTRVATEATFVVTRLRWWKRDVDLAAIRDGENLSRECVQLWYDVDALLDEASM